MIELIINRLSNWYSLVLFIVFIGSFLRVTQLMLEEQKKMETQPNQSKRVLVLAMLESVPNAGFTVLLLMNSSYLLYCQILALSREDVSLLSFFLHFGASLFVGLVLIIVIRVGEWLNSDNIEE